MAGMVGVGARGASSASKAPASPRNTPSVCRSSASASFEAPRIASRDAFTCAGSLSSTRSATPDCSEIIDSECPTTSWISRASRSRSFAAARSSASARSRRAAWRRDDSTATPRAGSSVQIVPENRIRQVLRSSVSISFDANPAHATITGTATK